MKSVKLNSSSKYKNNKFQIKYLKAKKNNIVLFATYDADWDEEDSIFYRAYNFFIYFNRNKRAVHYIENNPVYPCYSCCEFNSNSNISSNNMNSFMNSFQRNASEFLDEVMS